MHFLRHLKFVKKSNLELKDSMEKYIKRETPSNKVVVLNIIELQQEQASWKNASIKLKIMKISKW